MKVIIRIVIVFFISFGWINTDGSISDDVQAEEISKNLTLKDSIDIALQNNTDIEIGNLEKEKAEEVVKEKRAGAGPVFNFIHKDSYLKYDPTEMQPKKNTDGTTYMYLWPITSAIGTEAVNEITLAVPVYDGGQISNSIKEAKLGEIYANQDFRKNVNTIKLDTITAYYDVLETKNLFRVSKESVDALDEHLRSVRGLFESGIVAKSDVLRSEVELINGQQKLLKAKNDYELSIASLNNVMGLPLGTAINVTDVLTYKNEDVPFNLLKTRSLNDSPVILESKIQKESSELDLKSAKAGYVPSVTFQASSTVNDVKFPGVKGNYWTLDLITNWNIFDSGLTKAKIGEAVVTNKTNLSEDKKIHDAIELDLEKNYLSMGEAKQRIITTESGVSKAEEDFRIAKVRYELGMVLLLVSFVLALPKTFAKICSLILPHNGLKFGTSRDAKL